MSHAWQFVPLMYEGDELPRARKHPESGVYVRLCPYSCAAAMVERPPAIQEARPLLAIVLHAVRHQKLCGIPYRSRAA